MSEGRVFLAMDTATGPASVALWMGGQVAACLENPVSSQQSACLMPMVEQAMTQCSIGYGDLSGIACTVGPGSFTGIRVGLAAAGGICFAAAKPGMGFSTLETVAFGAREEASGQPILAILNAGKGEVYYQAFAAAPAWQALYEPKLGTLEEALASAGTDPLVAGNMEIPSAMRRAAIRFPRADALAMLAAARGGHALPLIPFYIRDPDAKPMALDR